MSEKEQKEFLYKFFDPSLPRLGPGDAGSTKRALDMAISAGLKQGSEQGSDGLRVMDIGCGNGAQTIQLAKHIDGTILAIDDHQPFLDELERRAEAEGVSDKIHTWLKDMRELGPEAGSFDLIWCEGAIFSIGFQKGLELWHSLLIPGGFMAVSELIWLRPDPPEECRQWLTSMYPPIVELDTNLSIIEKCGYKITGHFTLPESVWWDSYFHPIEKRLKAFREEYGKEPKGIEMADSIEIEIEQYRKYSSYYGYGFFVMQRQ